MADTTKVSMSKNWVKISDGDCTVQANSNEQFQFSIGATAPTPTSDAGLFLRISEPVTLAYKTAVWCRLPASYVHNDTIAISIVK